MKKQQWLKDSIAEMVQIQQWHKEHNRQKSNSVQLKLSLAYAVVEYIKYGDCINHKARIHSTDFFNDFQDKSYKCIEDITSNRDLASYIHKLKVNVFYNYNDWVKFTTLHSRRFNEPKNYTSSAEIVIKTAFKDKQQEVARIDLRYHYGKDLEFSAKDLNLKELTPIMMIGLTKSGAESRSWGNTETPIMIDEDVKIRISIPEYKEI